MVSNSELKIEMLHNEYWRSRGKKISFHCVVKCWVLSASLAAILIFLSFNVLNHNLDLILCQRSWFIFDCIFVLNLFNRSLLALPTINTTVYPCTDLSQCLWLCDYLSYPCFYKLFFIHNGLQLRCDFSKAVFLCIWLSCWEYSSPSSSGNVFCVYSKTALLKHFPLLLCLSALQHRVSSSQLFFCDIKHPAHYFAYSQVV